MGTQTRFSLRIALIAENFLPQIDGVTLTVARLLQHLREEGHEAVLIGPDSDNMTAYCGHPIVPTSGLPLPWYPDLKYNFFRPLIRLFLSSFPLTMLTKMAGRWEKNLRLLVEAVRGLQLATPERPACKLVIVGDGPSKSSLELLCARYQLDAHFCGYLHGEALSAAYASADIFACPSFTETFALVAPEAMASGLPVVALRAEGLKDLVSSTRGCLMDLDDLLLATREHTVESIFDPASPAFENAVKRFRTLIACAAADAPMRQRMSVDAERFASIFTWRKAMDDVVLRYRQVIDEARTEQEAQQGLVPAAASMLDIYRATASVLLRVAGATLWSASGVILRKNQDFFAHVPANAADGRLATTPTAEASLNMDESVLPPNPASSPSSVSTLCSSTMLNEDGQKGSQNDVRLCDPAKTKMEKRLAFFSSSDLMSRVIILCVVVYQLTFWTILSLMRHGSLTA